MKKILIFLLLITINVKAETITITSNTKLNDKEISDEREQSNVLIVNNSELKIENSKIKKSGNGTDNVSNTPNNSAILIKEKGSLLANNLNVDTNGSFAHGIYFVNSDGKIENSNIKTNEKYGIGLIIDGNKVEVNKTNIETMEHDSSGIYVISGELEVKNSNITTNSVDSPLFKAASKISIIDTKLNANKSEGIIGIGGADITLSNTKLETNNITAEESNFTSVYFYNPLEEANKITFKATDSEINTKIGNTFTVVSCDADITLENNKISNTNGLFLYAMTNPYVEDGKNNINLKLKKQEIKGNIVLDGKTTLDIYLDNSNYVGAINPNSASKNVNITITKDSKMTLTSNVYVNSLTNGDYDNTNIDLNGYKLYINGEEISKDNIKHLDEKNDDLFIVCGFIIGLMLGFSVVYLYIRSKRTKSLKKK